MYNFNYTLLTYMLFIDYQISINVFNINKQTLLINNSSIFQSDKNITLIYNKTGKLKCKLITQHMQYTDSTKTVHLTQPVAILFNKHNTPTWNIQAQKAKITYDKIIHFHGNVQIINLTQCSYLKFITTNTATLNLITYDIFSNEKTTIHGTQFKTVAMNMKGNLKKKITKLSKKVYTLYEIQNTKKT